MDNPLIVHELYLLSPYAGLPSFLIQDVRVSSTVTFLPENEITACSAKAEVANSDVRSEAMINFFIMNILA